jgi:FKBP-type peptidyl-prolyl cis-trans isomerase FkpA
MLVLAPKRLSKALLLAGAMLAGLTLSCDQSAGIFRPLVAFPSGLEYWDITLGTGAVADSGKAVTIHYTIWLKDGRKIDSSFDRDSPFAFVLGTGSVIQGYDQGILGMRVGGKRYLLIPPELAYGSHGFPGRIPPNAWLRSLVQLLDVQ